MESGLLPIGILSLIVGAALGLWKKKRKFKRTNAYGVEQFSSFSGKATTRFLDGVLLLSAAVFLFAGLLAISKVYEDSFGWIVLLPVYAVILFFII